MKNALQVISWIAIVLGVAALVSGITEISTDPMSARYSLIGGLMYAAEGILALAYINSVEKSKKA